MVYICVKCTLSSDSIKRRFDQYPKMSEGRFLFRLTIVISSEKILKTKSLVKESIDIKDDLKVTENEDAIQQELFDNMMEIGFEYVMLSEETREVAAHIFGYILSWPKVSDTIVKITVITKK